MLLNSRRGPKRCFTVCVAAGPRSCGQGHNQLTVVFTADRVPSAPEHMQIGKDDQDLGFVLPSQKYACCYL